MATMIARWPLPLRPAWPTFLASNPSFIVGCVGPSPAATRRKNSAAPDAANPCLECAIVPVDTKKIYLLVVEIYGAPDIARDAAIKRLFEHESKKSVHLGLVPEIRPPEYNGNH